MLVGHEYLVDHDFDFLSQFQLVLRVSSNQGGSVRGNPITELTGESPDGDEAPGKGLRQFDEEPPPSDFRDDRLAAIFSEFSCAPE